MAEYTGQSIEVMDPIAHLRARAEMYLGDISGGPNHLFQEMFSNSIDEHLSGYGNKIVIRASEDGCSLSVEDFARGIPVEKGAHGLPGVHAVFTKLYSGGKFKEDSGYTISGGLHGVGLSAVGALCKLVQVEIHRDGKVWTSSYSRGQVVEELKATGKTKETGTKITIVEADSEIFPITEFNLQVIEEKIRDTSFLVPSCSFELWIGDKLTPIKSTGLGELIELRITDSLKQSKTAEKLCNPVTLSGKLDKTKIDLSFCFTNANNMNLLSFVNGIRTPDGGTHETAVKKIFFDSLRNWSEADKFEYSLDALQDGCFLALHYLTPERAFSSQDKVKFVGKGAGKDLQQVLGELLKSWVTANSDLLRRVFTLAEQRYLAKKQSSKLQELASKIKINNSKLKRGVIEGVSDCKSLEVEKCEIFFLEGESASGSVRISRDSNIQAILPLRGKVINAFRSELTGLLRNKEIQDIISALGCGYGKDCDASLLRYGKVILLCDPDSDGGHISSLLLSFIVKYLRPVLEAGRVYVVDSPLFCAKQGKERHYFKTSEELQAFLKDRKGKAWNVVRFKGYGECAPEEIKEMALDPSTRILYQIQLNEGSLKKTEQFMGEDSSFRKVLFME